MCRGVLVDQVVRWLWGCEFDGGSFPGDGPVVFVYESVVASTQQHEVVEAGGSSVCPVLNVVGVAPAVRSVAVGELACAVSYDEGAS